MTRKGCRSDRRHQPDNRRGFVIQKATIFAIPTLNQQRRERVLCAILPKLPLSRSVSIPGICEGVNLPRSLRLPAIRSQAANFSVSSGDTAWAPSSSAIEGATRREKRAACSTISCNISAKAWSSWMSPESRLDGTSARQSKKASHKSYFVLRVFARARPSDRWRYSLLRTWR
jgi:hypothetical protein